MLERKFKITGSMGSRLMGERQSRGGRGHNEDREATVARKGKQEAKTETRELREKCKKKGNAR